MKTQNALSQMTKFGCAGLLLLSGWATPASAQPSIVPIGYEVVGQVLNPSAQSSKQYGYLNHVEGIDRITTSAGAAISESTALFTFFNDTLTERVINSGPIRMVDRTGSGAIYLGTGNSDFSNPDSFKNGGGIQSYSLRHQVVIDTSTGYFTTTFEMTVTAVATFQIDGRTYRLGRPGGVYRVVVYGKLASPGPPSAYIAGVADGPDSKVVGID